MCLATTGTKRRTLRIRSCHWEGCKLVFPDYSARVTSWAGMGRVAEHGRVLGLPDLIFGCESHADLSRAHLRREVLDTLSDIQSTLQISGIVGFKRHPLARNRMLETEANGVQPLTFKM